MAPSKLKREPDLTPPPRKSLGFFKDDPDTSTSKASNFAEKVSPSLIPEAYWRECGGETKFKQVQIKELAAKNAHLSLRTMLTTLGLQLSANPSCQPRIDKINEIISRKKEYSVLVGFLGATGAGKTTLLNALIGYPDLLPSSAWRASTAAPTSIQYNRSSDKDSRFRADVVYITAEEWSQELKSLFEDIEAASTAEGDDEEGDSEREARIAESFDKVKYVYPHIRSLAKLESSSVQELLNHPDVRDALGSTRTISKPGRNELSAAIKRYIDSSDHNDKTSAHWPLVKLVKIFVKSDFLEPGIVLVDLPGNLDSNTARSAIAEKYHKDLSVSCIVADITRGISEKNAQELLEKFTKRNLQLDGLYNADSLCFILSKTDQHFDNVQYTKQYPDLGERIAPDSRKYWTLKGDISELQQKHNAVEKSHNANKKKAKELSKEIKVVSLRLDTFSSNSNSLPQPRKRGIDDVNTEAVSAPASTEQIELRNKLARLDKQLADLRNTIQKEADSLLSYGRRIKSLDRASFFARSRIQAQCIEHRNELSIAAVRSDYEATLKEMGREQGEQLQVFPVSATVHIRYLKSNNSHQSYMGFPNRDQTNISAFRDWLTGTTLTNREKCAQAFLDDVDALMASIQPWITDKFGESKMSAEVREYWEPQVNSMVAKLEINLRSLSINTTNDMKQLVKTNVYSKVLGAQKLAGAKAKRTAEKWAVGIHWSTHRMVNRQRGFWKDSKGKEHKWNEELVHNFTTHVVKPWDLTFYRQFPQEKTTYVDEAKKLLVNFAASATKRDVCPDVANGFDVLKDQILNTVNLVRNDTDAAWDDMKKTIKKSHKQAIPAVREFLEPMYEQCASESGKGHYARNKKYIEETMTDDGVAMHRTGAGAIKAELDQLLDNIPVRLAEGHHLALKQIRDEIKSFLEQHSSDGARNSTRKVVSIAKVRLQEALMADIHKLAKLWNATPTTAEEIPDDDEETEDEIGLDEELFIDLEEGDDGNYEDNSDGDID